VVQVLCVDAWSCNGCEIEIADAFNPVSDAERAPDPDQTRPASAH
jgi:Ni,Fe-hydrogenase III small subunit